MKRYIKVALLIVTLSLISLAESSADPTAVVTIANGSAAPGGSTNIRLSIAGVPEAGLSDLQGSLTYDPQVVHVESLKGLNDYQVFAYKIDNDLGRVRFVVVKVTGKFLREGDILQFRMKAVGKVGDTSLLELALEAFNDPNGKPVARRIENGTFTIKAQQAAFTFRPTEPRVNETVQFIDQSVGNIVRWLWDFGDGTGSTEQNPSHKYSAAGAYTVKLLIEDSAGATDIGLEEITVRPPNRPPRADFTFSPANPAVDEAVQFTDRSTDPDGDETIASWAWDFGDGTTSTAQNPTHSYSKAGTYTVKLKVTDNEGASDSTSKKVVVGGGGAPQADFSFSPENPKPGETVHFSDQSTDPDGEILSWSWDFGDGKTSADQNPSHKYLQRGVYSVRLTVTDNDGLSDTITKEITVGQPKPTVAVHCYPNPASTQTTFRYSLPQGAAKATLYIFDATGRLVFQHELEPAAQEYTWDLKSNGGADLPSGPYFYYIVAFDAAGKMIARSTIGKLVIRR